MIKIAPSILSADFARLGQEIESVRTGGADYLHFDVMDGLFVPNISVGLPVLASVRTATDMILDAHLMIERPVRYVEAFCKAGADIVTLHVESDSYSEIRRGLEKVRSLGKRAGIVLKPGTPAADALPWLELCSMVLVMTVEPGFGGQSFMMDMLPKLSELRELIERRGLDCEIEVDGGINPETAALAVGHGANVLVAGSDVFKAKERALRIAQLRGN